MKTITFSPYSKRRSGLGERARPLEDLVHLLVGEAEARRIEDAVLLRLLPDVPHLPNV